MSIDIPSSLKLRVTTPDKLLVDQEVKEVYIPGLDGYLGIFPGHRPLFVILGKGDISFRRAHKEVKICVQGGYAEVFPDKVIVLAEVNKNESRESNEGR